MCTYTYVRTCIPLPFMCVCIIVLWFKLVLFVKKIILEGLFYIIIYVHMYIHTCILRVCMYKHHVYYTKYSITIFTRYTCSIYVRRYMYTQSVVLTIWSSWKEKLINNYHINLIGMHTHSQEYYNLNMWWVNYLCSLADTQEVNMPVYIVGV
jgi:hypothetical protein